MFLRDNEIGARVARHIRPGDRVLDYGAGTGLISRWLAHRAHAKPTLADLVDYSNRRDGFPFLHMEDPFHVPAEDGAFDVVLLLFALHHNPYDAQADVLREGKRLSSSRMVIIEDTPMSRREWAMNAAWDRMLNLRHGVPTPLTFRRVPDWLTMFKEHGLRATAVESYRPMWPTLKTYHHTLFVVEPARTSNGQSAG